MIGTPHTGKSYPEQNTKRESILEQIKDDLCPDCGCHAICPCHVVKEKGGCIKCGVYDYEGFNK